jgi:hypothetical protein
MKLETVLSSELQTNFYLTTRRYIPEDSTVHSHHDENLKSNTINIRMEITINYSPINKSRSNKVIVFFVQSYGTIRSVKQRVTVFNGYSTQLNEQIVPVDIRVYTEISAC